MFLHRRNPAEAVWEIRSGRRSAAELARRESYIASRSCDQAAPSVDDLSSRLDDVESRLDDVESTAEVANTKINDVCDAFSGYPGAFEDIYLSTSLPETDPTANRSTHGDGVVPGPPLAT
jgi:hypothetical protein